MKPEGNVLRVAFDDGETLRLFPVSEDGLRVWGAPTRSVIYQFRNGAATGFRVERGGLRQSALVRASWPIVQ